MDTLDIRQWDGLLVLKDADMTDNYLQVLKINPDIKTCGSAVSV